MKTLPRMIILFITISLISHLVITKVNKSHKKIKSHNKNKHTPQSLDLDNHYGENRVGSHYGPPTQYSEYVEKNPEVFTPQRFNGWKNVDKALEFKPYPGWENKLNPHQVKSGDFTNVAPSANGIITPEITGPKLHVQSELNYPAHVKIPTFYGFRKEYHPVTVYDKAEGKIEHDNVLLSKPWYGWENKTENIKREYNQFINLNNGEIIKKNEKLENHGIERPEPEAKKCHCNSKNRRLRRI
jgi:hypothetical protein